MVSTIHNASDSPCQHCALLVLVVVLMLVLLLLLLLLLVLVLLKLDRWWVRFSGKAQLGHADLPNSAKNKVRISVHTLWKLHT